MGGQRVAVFDAYTLTLRQTGRCVTRFCGDNFALPFRAARLTVVMDGQVTVRSADNTYVLGPRACFLAAGWHHWQLEAVDAVVLDIDVDVARTQLRGTFDLTSFVVWMPDAVLPSACAAALVELMNYHGVSGMVFAEILRVVDNLVSAMVTCSINARLMPHLEFAERSRVIDYVREHFVEHDLTPSRLAVHFGVSTRTLHRFFEGEEVSVRGWIAASRLDLALKMLQEPAYAQMTLEEIARECGYGSALAMRRAVLLRLGITPSQLRSQTPLHKPLQAA